MFSLPGDVSISNVAEVSYEKERKSTFWRFDFSFFFLSCIRRNEVSAKVKKETDKKEKIPRPRNKNQKNMRICARSVRRKIRKTIFWIALTQNLIVRLGRRLPVTTTSFLFEK